MFQINKDSSAGKSPNSNKTIKPKLINKSGNITAGVVVLAPSSLANSLSILPPNQTIYHSGSSVLAMQAVNGESSQGTEGIKFKAGELIILRLQFMS